MKEETKFILIICLGAMIFQGLVSCRTSMDSPEPKKNSRQNPVLSDQVDKIIRGKMDLVRILLKDKNIYEAVRLSNQKHKDITPEEIQKLDRKWIETKGIDGYIKGFITNKAAKQLVQFQDQNDGFPEIFVTDAKGLNVCQTNKTSDFYQADEKWWMDAFNEGAGRAYYGEIEYDESVHAEAIPLYVPVIEPRMKRAIGVAKVILNLNAIKLEL